MAPDLPDDPNDLPIVHDLKVIPPYFDLVIAGFKPFELRKQDRRFRVGDYVNLREYLPKSPETNKYTGRLVTMRIRYIYTPMPGEDFGLKEGYCILGLRPLTCSLLEQLEGGGVREVYTASNKCPYCAVKLEYDPGYDQAQDEPGQTPVIYCPACGSHFPIDWDKLQQQAEQLRKHLTDIKRLGLQV